MDKLFVIELTCFGSSLVPIFLLPQDFRFIVWGCLVATGWGIFGYQQGIQKSAKMGHLHE